MKKYFNYSLMLMLVGLLFASCADEYKSYTPAKIDTDQVYFSKDLSHDFDLEDFDVKEITIPVSRQKTDNELTVQLGLIDTQDTVFTLKTKTVTFPAGAATANAVVTFDASKWDYDEFKTGSIYIVDDVIEPEELVLPEDSTATDSTKTENGAARRKAQEQTNTPNPQYTTQWGDHSFYFIVGVPAPFEAVGIGTFTDAFWEEGTCDVQILRNTVNPNIYRIVDPYGSFGQSYYDDNRTMNLDIEILKPGDKLGDVEITQEDLIFYSIFNIGYFHSSYSQYINLIHPYYFGGDESTFLFNKVVAYQEDGTPGEINIAPYYYMNGVGGWNHTSDMGTMKVVFPGYEPKDYALEITYKGIFNDTNEVPFAVVAATLGEDVETVKAVVIEADADPDAVADAIEAGELEATDIDTSNLDFIQVPIAEDLTGKLQVVLVVIDADGKAQTVASANFEYFGKGDANPWVSLGKGLYTDNFFGPLFTRAGEPIGPYEVEVQENQNEPGLYRLVDPYSADNFTLTTAEDSYTNTTIEIDATDPEGVIIYPQFTGADYGYGAISIASAGGGYAANYDLETLKEYGYLGTLSEGVITLPNKTYTYQENEESEPIEVPYQGFVFMGSSTYHTGVEDGFKLVLPSAVTTEARKRAQAIMSWTDLVNSFEHKKVTKKQMCIFTKAQIVRTSR